MVQFPWGSLARGVAGLDGPVLTGLASLLHDGGLLRVLVSATERDRGRLGFGPERLDDAAAIARAWAACGLALTVVLPAEAADLASAQSTWARRLATHAGRAVTLLEGTRGAVAGSGGRP